jgi:hypothetical protein
MVHRKKRKGDLVPLLEDLFQHPVEISSQEDIYWLAGVLATMVARNTAREEAPLFSPSQLSECLRYVYLLKNYKELDISKLSLTRIEPNFYFFNGNFLHLKWQFALHKLDQKLPDEIFKLHGVEVPVVSKRKDHGGTVDALCSIYSEPVIVDFKGLNVRTFTNITHGTIPSSYLLQIPDYGMLYNSQRNGTEKIARGLLLTENKGGPDPKHPIALHETVIPIELYLPSVRTRLRKLRKHESDNTIPQPECTSTQTIQFQSCPFRGYCRPEVKAIQRERAEADRRNAEKLKIARPSRSRTGSSRRNSDR